MYSKTIEVVEVIGCWWLWSPEEKRPNYHKLWHNGAICNWDNLSKWYQRHPQSSAYKSSTSSRWWRSNSPTVLLRESIFSSVRPSMDFITKQCKIRADLLEYACSQPFINSLHRTSPSGSGTGPWGNSGALLLLGHRRSQFLLFTSQRNWHWRARILFPLHVSSQRHRRQGGLVPKAVMKEVMTNYSANK